MLLVLTVLAALAFHSGSLPLALRQVGDTWPGETLIAPQSFAVDKVADSLAADQERAQQLTEPIFVAIPDAAERTTANMDSLQQQMDRIMLAYQDYRINMLRSMLIIPTEVEAISYRALADRDSVWYMEERRSARIFLSDELWRMLGNDVVARDPRMPDSIRLVAPGPPVYEYALERLWAHAGAFSRSQVLNIPTDSVKTEFLKVRHTGASTFERVPVNQVFDQQRVYSNLEPDLTDALGGNAQAAASIATALINAVFVASLQFDEGATSRAQDQAAREVSPTRGMVAKDEIVVRSGEVITPEIKQRLESLQRERIESRGPAPLAPQSLGKLLLAFCTFALFFAYLYVARRHILGSPRQMLMISLLYASIIAIFAVAIRNDVIFMFAVPTLLVSVILTVAFDSRVGLFGTIVLALLGGLVSGTGYGFEFAFATVVGGALAVFAIRGARNRAKFFASAGSAFAGYAFVFMAYWLFESEARQFTNNLIMAGINCFLLFAAFPLLWVFERAFQVSSDLRLVELGDYNQSLLKRLQQEAAGTFNHTLQVASLAEAAAEAIGAESLLTRVGGLYHDIGKLHDPQYFIENQRAGANPHDELSAQESAAIIRDHVAHGLALAQEAGLPGNIVEFISMHHGSTRIEYFYHKARLESGKEAVDEKDFRYPGPRPRTRETAILMLTDGIEAACKSITKPTVQALEERIEQVISARIQDGQLDEAPLSFRDLRVIKETLLHRLAAAYHVRIKYPGQQ